MNAFIPLPANKAYQLINPGPLTVIGTKAASGQLNLAPINWTCPVEYDPQTRLLIVCDKTHQTYANIVASNRFVLQVPHADRLDLVSKIGGCSGKSVDKLAAFDIPHFLSPKFNLPVMLGCIGFIECEVYDKLDDGEVSIIRALSINAMVNTQAWDGRLLSEKPEGKTLHHMGDKRFYTPGNELL